jgi:hypothetical protein
MVTTRSCEEVHIGQPPNQPSNFRIFDTWDHLREWNARKDHLWKFLSKKRHVAGPCRRCRRRHVGLRSTPCGHVTMPPLTLAASASIFFILFTCFVICFVTKLVPRHPCRQRGWRQGPPSPGQGVPPLIGGLFWQKISQVVFSSISLVAGGLMCQKFPISLEVVNLNSPTCHRTSFVKHIMKPSSFSHDIVNIQSWYVTVNIPQHKKNLGMQWIHVLFSKFFQKAYYTYDTIYSKRGRMTPWDPTKSQV